MTRIFFVVISVFVLSTFQFLAVAQTKYQFCIKGLESEIVTVDSSYAFNNKATLTFLQTESDSLLILSLKIESQQWLCLAKHTDTLEFIESTFFNPVTGEIRDMAVNVGVYVPLRYYCNINSWNSKEANFSSLSELLPISEVHFNRDLYDVLVAKK